MSYAPEVRVRGEGDEFYGNSLRFATREEAEGNVADLASRWALVEETRVVESNDPVNYRWDEDLGLVRINREVTT